MKSPIKLHALVSSLFICFVLGIGSAIAATTNNQTDTLSAISPGTDLPFRVVIERANFQLPVGLHSGVVGVYKGLWVFIAGRVNGLHGFGSDPFPPDQQNTSIYVVDPSNGSFQSRSLSDPSSGLSQQQIDTLSVTSPEGYQVNNTFYMVGGYGVDTATGTFNTKPVLTSIYLPGIVKWVRGNSLHNGVLKNMRQLYNPLFQITGGRMFRIGAVTNLVFGQNFSGVYSTDSNGEYSEQVRRFRIIDNGNRLDVKIENSNPHNPDPNYRRRDLNVTPVLTTIRGRPTYSLVAFSGVFTPDSGVWTVPVVIDENGNPTMADPNLPGTFKQGMNQYVSAAAGLYSRTRKNMYNLFFGGISYGYYSNGEFETDAEIPFINQVTTIKMDNNGHFTQYLMDAEYPTILSTQSNPGNTLLFGAGANFMVNQNLPHFKNKIIQLDRIRKPTVIGYIAGGIQSTLANTNTRADSAASPYVFVVTLIPA
jgi:hypothetical protein